MPDKQPSLMGVARRDLARLSKLSATVIRHGFGELVLQTPLGRRLQARGELPEADGAPVQGSAAVRFTRMLGSLGPTFVKLGQVLSMRQDLLGPEWIAALETLQDRAPAVPFERIQASIQAGLGIPLEEAFAELAPEPLASASIAQTHLATTQDGDRVVVKVQREGIEAVMRGDLDLLYLAAQILEASIDEMRLFGVTDIVVELERALLRELDFRDELANLLKMRSLLDPERHATVPRPYPELSGKTVLTMQHFSGQAVRSLEPGSPRARHAVEEIVHAACKQVFIDGFFHGDPHGGNLLYGEDGTLCMIDLGLVGTLSEEQREDLVTLIVAIMANDSATVARVLLKMGTPQQRVSLQALRSEVERIRAKYLAVESLQEVDTAGFMQELTSTAQRFRIKLASEYAVLMKSAGTIEGIVRRLHPDVPLVAIARPYVQQMMTRRVSPQAMLRELTSGASMLGSMVWRLPAQLDQLVHDFETGNLQIRAVNPSFERVPDVVYQAASRVSLSLFATAMTLCCALVLLAQREPRWIYIALSVASGLAAAGAWTLLFWWHVVGRGKPLRLAPLLKLFRR